MRTVLLLLLLLCTVLCKKLECTSQATLRNALVDEGLEATLGYLGKSSSVQKMVANLQNQLTDPWERYERIMCPGKQFACMRCKNAAKISQYKLHQFAQNEVACHMKKEQNCKCRRMEEALFLLNVETFAAFTPINEIDEKLVAFLSAYSPEYDVYAESLVGQVQQAVDGTRAAQLVKTDMAFNSSLFNFGERYVGCTELKYVQKQSGTSVLRFYACKEFVLRVSNAAGIVFLYHMYHQADHQPKTNKPILSRFFGLFDEFMEAMEKSMNLQAGLDRLRAQRRIQTDPTKARELRRQATYQRAQWAKSDKVLDALVDKMIHLMTPAVQKSTLPTESKVIQVVTLAQAYLQGHANTMSITASKIGTMFSKLNQCASVSTTSRYAASAHCGIVNFIIEMDVSE